MVFAFSFVIIQFVSQFLFHDVIRETLLFVDAWWQGDRMISALYYLSNSDSFEMTSQESPRVGGATIFPQAHLAVHGEPGDLLVWQNLDFSSGLPLPELNHGSCPVVSGQKWIANKWIRYYDQMSNLPCLLLYKKES
jgi:hypothetical protein